MYNLKCRNRHFKCNLHVAALLKGHLSLKRSPSVTGPSTTEKNLQKLTVQKSLAARVPDGCFKCEHVDCAKVDSR